MGSNAAPSVDEIVDTFRADDVDRRRRLIARCPPGKFTGMASMAAGFTTVGGNMQALQFMIQSYAFEDQDFGIAFGEACYRLGREMYDGPHSNNTIFLLAAGNGSVGWLTCLSNIGRHADARARGTEVLKWLERHGDTTHVVPMRLRLVEAALGLEDFDEAERLLDRIDESSLAFPVNITYRALRDRLRQYKQKATGVTSAQSGDPSQRLRDILGIASAAAAGGQPNTATSTDSVTKLRPAANGMMRMLGGADKDNELAVSHRIVKANELFHDPVAGRNPGRIAEVEAILRAGRDWMRAHKAPDGENDACWGLYLCYSRTGREREAVDSLRTIRANIERARANIADPIERAGLTARYPQLYPCLVTLLYKLQDGPGLFEAIEGAKGRALADVMTLGARKAVADSSFSAALEELPGALEKAKGQRAHYLTYFVDDDCTYAVLVTSNDGGAIEIAKSPVSRADLERLAREIREAASAGPGAADSMPADLGERLAPLLDLASDRIEDGDHLSYSPDDVLHLLPLQTASDRRGPLVRRASVSRVHGAHVLSELLRRSPGARRPPIVVEVPAGTDAADPARIEVFAKAGRWLRASNKAAQVLSGESADIDALRKAELRGAVIHFATHGVFPPNGAKGAAANPYHASGLLLAAGGKLPDLHAADRGHAGDHLLSPARLVNAALALDGSHITLQACVSGLSREGIGGDALGLEWALFQLGAASILSTHWNVSATTSGAFAERFYTHLVKERQSRAAAWRQTVLEFLDRGDALAMPYHWSAFSLSGDWR